MNFAIFNIIVKLFKVCFDEIQQALTVYGCFNVKFALHFAHVTAFGVI